MRRIDYVSCIIDCSGSMNGQPISSVNTQLRELLSQLRELVTYRERDYGIALGFIYLRDTAYISRPVLRPVQNIQSIREVEITPGADGLYPTANYSEMFGFMEHTLNCLSKEEFKEKYVNYFILFTDSYSPRPDKKTEDAFASLNRIPRFHDTDYCKRYVVCDNGDTGKLSQVGGVVNLFAGNGGKVFAGQNFSELLSELSANLLDNTDNSVFYI